ncbi:hypothetical protein DFH28DRAFT_928694 [Melampsora americana]|nr:hypothetical protein DFH28DRAFT_928694 [Melampsora americana]
MSESLTMQPDGIPFMGPMNELLEPPDERVGDDRGATCIKQKPLYRVGTDARNQFDAKNQATIEVKFKIYTDDNVDINAPAKTTAKGVAGKKTSKTVKLNLINSTAINSNYLCFKTCLFGKSLNEFKTLCANRSELYKGGIKTIILDCAFSPGLKWKALVGRFKTTLDDGDKWQAFVTALEKSVKKFGTVSVENDNSVVKSNVETKESATKSLIAKTKAKAKPGSDESEKLTKDAQLQKFACEVFSKHGSKGFAGGDGTILTAPWDPTFRYRLTMAASWIWAKGIMAGVASVYIPPNTADFRKEIKRSHPQKLQQTQQKEGTSNDNHVDSSTLINNGSSNNHLKPGLNLPIDEKPDLTKIGDKRHTGELRLSKDLEKDLKKIKVETQPGDSFDEPISLSSDSESGFEDESDGMCHAGELEEFLVNCNIPPEDLKTRKLLTGAGILSWTDLIPSVQLTETTLNSKGIHRQIASRLMEAAQAQYWDCKFHCIYSNIMAKL